MDNEEFYKIIEDIITNEAFVGSSQYPHHKNKSCYDHCLDVAKKSYEYGKKHNLNYVEMTRGALLHDFYLYDWHDPHKGFHFHGYRHPRLALNNAKKYFTLTKIEEDIILNHMFPLTLFKIPKSKESFMVSTIDKMCSFTDYFKRSKK